MFLWIVLLGLVTGLNKRPENVNDLSEILYGYQYKGQWISQKDGQQFHYLTVEQGDAYMIFLSNNTQWNNDTDVIDRFKFQLLNPKYEELGQVYGIFKLTNYSDTDISFNNISVINYTTYYKFRRNYYSKENCEITYNITIEFQSDHYDKEHAEIDVHLKTQNNTLDPHCDVDIKMNFTLDTTNYLLGIIMYCAMSVMICFTQFLCVTKLCKALLENEEDPNKISLFAIGYLTVQDSYICLQNLYQALITYQYFQYFILPAFFYFLLATTCDMKLIWIVWRSRHLDDLFDQQRMRKAITYFFAQFYFSLIIYFILMYFFYPYNWFIYITGMCLLPQIIHNVRIGNNPKFISYYIFGILIPSMIYQIYNRACPTNLHGFEPSVAFCMIFLSEYLLQIIVLYIQFKLGPRSFIPKCFLPKQYKYLRILNIQEDYEECAICLTSLSDDPFDTQDLTEKLIIKQAMLTPCKHWFHPSCLRSWIDIKMQCPTCRSDLPPLLE
ncbi:unnamed protein product [Paramecium sonneborni]|uniref:RING-type E3 ubiquitin transferase n=1 Tax=Paramecium sonneborni TaxID=65129 RepID=A0A8S1JY13_9CILI|nr:unnamed protein product [Paramecium sonneborni]